MPSEPQRKVSIIIPTWKRGDLLRNCLESLRRQTYIDFETVIVSNGAGDWAATLGEEFGAKIVRFAENRGFAAAVNAGIAASNSPYVAVLNDDAELETLWLEKTTALLEERRDLAFCCGKIYRPDGRTIDNAGDALSLGGGAWRLGFGRADSLEFAQSRPLFAISMTAALIRREVFEKLGGLDEAFCSYLEDMDFSIRAHRAGYQGLYLPQAVARHHGGATSRGPESHQTFRLLTRNQLALLFKQYPLSLWLRLAPRIAWAQFLWAAMAVRKGRFAAYLRGLLNFIRTAPAMRRNRACWSRQERRVFLTWLRESERAIHEDIFARPRPERDTYWRLYFFLFPVRRFSRKPVAAIDKLTHGVNPEEK
jgi:GT2 family glycosyltransferase